MSVNSYSKTGATHSRKFDGYVAGSQNDLDRSGRYGGMWTLQQAVGSQSVNLALRNEGHGRSAKSEPIPRTDGKLWKPKVVHYDLDSVVKYLKKIGYLE